MQIIGINEFSKSSDNAIITDGRDIPWLQDADADGDGVSDVFQNSWPAGHLDVVIVDAANMPVGILNLGDFSLAETSNYEQLKAIFMNVASSPPVMSPPEADVNFDFIVDRADIGLLGESFGDDIGVTRSSGDLNGDHSVDLKDLAKLRRQLQQVAVSSAGQDVGMGSIIQAENFSHRHSTTDFAWYLIDDVEAAGVGDVSGMSADDGLYLQALDAHQAAAQPESPTTDDTYLEYGVAITTSGVYGLDLRVAGFDDGSDSLWAQIPTGTLLSNLGRPIDSGDAVRARTGSNSDFAWQNAGLWTLDAGIHRIRLSMRESGAVLDALRLQRVVNSPAAAASIISRVGAVDPSDEAPADVFARAVAVDQLFKRIGTASREARLLSKSRRVVRALTAIRDTTLPSTLGVADDGVRRDANRPALRLTRSHRAGQRLVPRGVDVSPETESI